MPFLLPILTSGNFSLDLITGNILSYKEQETFRFTLVDINRMQFKKITVRDAVKNFSRLAISREALSCVTREYARIRGLDEDSFARQANQYSDRVYKKYTSRLAWKAWEKGGNWFNHPISSIHTDCSALSFFTETVREHFTKTSPDLHLLPLRLIS